MYCNSTNFLFIERAGAVVVGLNLCHIQNGIFLILTPVSNSFSINGRKAMETRFHGKFLPADTESRMKMLACSLRRVNVIISMAVTIGVAQGKHCRRKTYESVYRAFAGHKCWRE